MRSHLLHIVSILFLSTAAPVLAQSSSFYVNGSVRADLGYSGGNSVRAGVLDLSFGIAPDTSGSFGGIGFEFGAYAHGMSAGGISLSDGTAFAAATFALGGGRLHVGAPRSGSWGYADVRVPGGGASLLAMASAFLGMTPFSTMTAVNADRPALGVMYERQSGGLRYSASLGRINVPVFAPTFVGLGMEYSTDRSRVYGTLEYADAAGAVATQLGLGGSTRIASNLSSLGEVEVGAALSVFDDGMSTITSANIFATAQVNDRLSLTASVLHSTFGGSQTLYGVNVNYEIWNSAVLNAGYSDATVGSSVWTLGLSRRF